MLELMLLRPSRRPRLVRHLPLVAMVARHHADAASSLGEDWRVYEWGFGIFGFGRVTGLKGKGNEKWVIWNDEMVRRNGNGSGSGRVS